MVHSCGGGAGLVQNYRLRHQHDQLPPAPDPALAPQQFGIFGIDTVDSKFLLYLNRYRYC